MKYHDFIREDCECLLALSEDTAHFIWLLRKLGYEVKEGLHIAVKVPGMKRFARLDTIDKRYARDRLEQTIAEAQGRKIHFPVRTFNTDKYYHSALNPYPKRYYYQIRGIRVVEKYRFGYKAAKYYKDIMLLQKLQEEYLFLCDNHIHSLEDLLDYRSNAVDELNRIRSEQQEIYARNAALKRKCDTPEGLREYQAEHIKNGQRLDELKKRAGQLRKGKNLSERQLAASINEALERIGREYPAESLEIDPSISDVPEYPVAVARLKAEKERREAEVRAEAERQAAKRAVEERAKKKAEAVADDVMQGVDIPEIQEPDREDGLFRTEIPDNDIGQAEVLDDTIVQTEQPVFSTFVITAKESETEVPDTLEQSEPVSRRRDSMKNTESSLESPAEKTVAKQDYMRMTDKEKAEWIGISLSDMPGSIKHFKSKMEQLGIWQESTIEMTDEFMKLWNQAEKERDALRNRKDYQQVRRR